jgi:hypothetical protein
MATIAGGLVAGRQVTAAGAPDTTDGVPSKPLPPVMSPEALRQLVKEAGLEDESPAKVAKRVGFSRIQWWRLLNGKTNISKRSAALIRSKLKPKKK